MKTQYVILSSMLAIVTSVHADEFARWTWRVPNPPAILWEKVAFANGQFIAVGDLGSIMTSTNGKDWFLENTVTTNRLLNIFYGDRYVASGNRGTVVSSPDVHEWQLASFPNDHTLLAMAYGNDLYAAFDVYGNFYRSTNALNWEIVEPPAPTTGADMAFGGGQFVLVGAAGLIMTSTNGLDWVQRESNTTGNFLSVAYGSGKFVAVGSESDDTGHSTSFIDTSFNGIDWFYQSLNTDILVRDITFADGQFVLVGGDSLTGKNISQSSSDGIYFNSASGDNGLGNTDINGVACGNGVCVAVGGGVYNSTDGGLTWTNVNSGPLEAIYSFAQKDGTVVGVGNGGVILTTTNGVTWSDQTVREDAGWRSICASADRFVAVGTKGALASSPDGLNWTSYDSVTSGTLWDVAYGAGRFVAVAWETVGKPYGYFVTSANGSDWDEIRPLFQKYVGYSITWGANLFVAAGYDGTNFVSSDGLSWAAETTGIPNTAFPIYYRNGRFIAPTQGGIAISDDGHHWTMNAVERPSLNSLTYGNGVYLATAALPQPALWSSADGINWKMEKIGVNSLYSSVYAYDSFFVGGTVLQSQTSLIPSMDRVHRSGNEIDADVFGRIGRSYELQSSIDLTTWQHETNYNQGQRFQPLTLPTGPGQKFFRVKLNEP